MSKEGYIPRPTTLRGRIDWRVTNVAIKLVKGHFKKDLTVRGGIAFEGWVEKIIAGEYVRLSDEAADLDGHEFSIPGKEHIAELEGRAAILIANHPKEGPLEGSYHPQETSDLFQEDLGRELKWVQGSGGEKLHPMIEMFPPVRSFVNYFVELVHRRKAAVNRSIYANGKNDLVVAGEIDKSLRAGEIVALCPERKQSEALAQADQRIGTLLYRQATRIGTPVIGVASFSWNNELVIAMTEVIEPETIQKIGDSVPREERGHAVIDYVFWRIAQQMPEKFQGYYRDYPPASSELLNLFAQASQELLRVEE